MTISVTFIVFAASLAGIALLFILKYAEAATGKTLLPGTRRALDARAEEVERWGAFLAHVIEHIPAFLVVFLYFSVHVTAVLVALIARSAERQAHKVADFVSHRRTFERKETRSDFLKEVSHHKETLVVPDDVHEHE